MRSLKQRFIFNQIKDINFMSISNWNVAMIAKTPMKKAQKEGMELLSFLGLTFISMTSQVVLASI